MRHRYISVKEIEPQYKTLEKASLGQTGYNVAKELIFHARVTVFTHERLHPFHERGSDVGLVPRSIWLLRFQAKCVWLQPPQILDLPMLGAEVREVGVQCINSQVDIALTCEELQMPHA